MSEEILTSNFFELFGLPVSYRVDLNQVQQRYMVLQKQVHPDNFANGSDQEKRISMQQTSWINEAKATLEDPVARAIYLLGLKDIDFSLENETTMDAGFLMQQLEMRERLENIQSESEPLDRLEGMAEEVKAAATVMMDGFVKSFEDERLDEAREWIRKLQFMQKAKKEINTLIGDIEDELMS
ncbi:MAG TPA: Fe-S protein assembly co-chaperone HscB [Gammaproteobacteria bacterium]|nr:Fe-S protein assembly co-chaperone HscB [Gammaproteobacteria bacterium]